MGTFAISTADDAIVSLTVGDMATFAEWAGSDTAVKAFVAGLGDAAYYGPSTAEEPFVLVFRKGTRAVRLVSMKKDDAGNRAITAEQLRELGDLIASRM